ncbi:MAG TPA: oligosaccharide flippase family protein [Bryobacteraceae bacterium]|nr:oligosaccharide flippase family protein [Bryobacteraceae bacterium]
MTSRQAAASSPRSVFRSILQASSLYSLALIVPRIVSVLLLPVITRLLTRADYGILDLLEQVGLVLALLLGAGFASGLGFFYFRADSPENRRRVVGTTMLGAAGIGLLAAAISWPFAGQLSRLVFRTDQTRSYLQLVMFSLPFSFLLEALFGWVRVENRPGVFVVASLLRVTATTAGIVVFLAMFGLHVWGMLFATLTAILLTAAFLGVYCVRTARPLFDVRLFGQMARFSAPIGLGALAVFIMNFGDRLILPHYITFDDQGVYALAYKIGMLVSFVYTSFHVYWSAQVFQIMGRDDSETIFARILTYVVGGISFCGLALIVLTPPVFRILVPPAFRGASALVPIIVIAYCIRSLGDFFRCLFVALGKPGYEATSNWLGAAVCLVAYALLIPRYGVWGAAGATVGAFVVMAIVSVIWTYRLKPYRVEAGRLLKVGIALSASVLSFTFVQASSLPAQVASAMLALLLFPAVLLVSRFPTPGEFEILREAGHFLTRRLPAGARGGNG